MQRKVRGARERKFESQMKSLLDLPLRNIAAIKSFCVTGVRKFQELFPLGFFFPPYNPFFLTREFEDKLKNKSNVRLTTTSLKGITKSNKLKLLLCSVCAHVYMHHLLKANRTVSV